MANEELEDEPKDQRVEKSYFFKRRSKSKEKTRENEVEHESPKVKPKVDVVLNKIVQVEVTEIVERVNEIESICDNESLEERSLIKENETNCDENEQELMKPELNVVTVHIEPEIKIEDPVQDELVSSSPISQDNTCVDERENDSMNHDTDEMNTVRTNNEDIIEKVQNTNEEILEKVQNTNEDETRVQADFDTGEIDRTARDKKEPIEHDDEEDPLGFIEIKSAAQWKAVSKRISWTFDENDAETDTPTPPAFDEQKSPEINETTNRKSPTPLPLTANEIQSSVPVVKESSPVLHDYNNIKFDIYCPEYDDSEPNFKPTK